MPSPVAESPGRQMSPLLQSALLVQVSPRPPSTGLVGGAPLSTTTYTVLVTVMTAASTWTGGGAVSEQTPLKQPRPDSQSARLVQDSPDLLSTGPGVTAVVEPPSMGVAGAADFEQM